MSKGIKTREVVKETKIRDTSVSVSGRKKNIGVKTKEIINENTKQVDNVSPEEYATDKISELMKRGSGVVAVVTEKSVREGASKAKEKLSKSRVAKKNDKITQLKIDKSNTKVVKEKNKAPAKTKSVTTIKKGETEKQTVKNGYQKIKQSKRSLDGATKGMKKADNRVKTTASTTKKTVEIAKRTKQTAQVTARVTIKTVKVAAKVVVEAGKTIVAGVKSIGAIIAGGGGVAVAVIIVICLIGAIGSTCFGIFLANDETTGTNKTVSQAISELASEHYANLSTIKSSYTYDILEMQGDTSINWKNVLAVYAVKTTSGENPLEVVTFDDKKIDLLRGIMKDMNTMKVVVTPNVVAETKVTTDEEGNSIKTTSYVTKQLLTISINQLNIEEIADLYNFNEEQKALLKELMSEKYDDLWSELIGASGHVIQSNSSFVGTGIFAWPFEHDQYISSPFGTRVDPISGEIKTHCGTDIAAPLGTPILAAADGVVVTAIWSNSYGYYVKIKHDDTYSTLYAHCSALYVSPGESVKQGQVIADCGSTGYSTGPHLHFEAIQNGVKVDILNFFMSK